MTPNDLDVLIVGAGISGISAAYHLQTLCPGKNLQRYIAQSRGRGGRMFALA